MDEKQILLEVYKLKNNAGFTTLCDTFMEKLKEIQIQLSEATEPDDILTIHAQWKAINLLYSMLINAPNEAKENFESSYRIGIDEALLGNF